MANTIDSNNTLDDSTGSKENKKEDPKEDASGITKSPVMESALHVNTSESSRPKRRWCQNNKRWREGLKKVVEADEAALTRAEGIYYLNDPEFCIAKGIDGIEIFLGLRDDGTEVAIKRISKHHINYQLLENEEEILRLPGLDHSFIVRYIDSVEDDNFRYLCLQLFEYTLDEYIKDCPEDKLYRIMRFILKAVKVLHDQDPPIFHWDLSPQNFWIGKTS